MKPRLALDQPAPRRVGLAPHGIARRIFRRGKAALELLVEARQFAEDLDRDVWDFALEIETLRSRGLVHSDLRWLVCKGYLEQASEMLPGSGQERRFHHGGVLTFTETSCFVMTDPGMDLLRQMNELDGSDGIGAAEPVPDLEGGAGRDASGGPQLSPSRATSATTSDGVRPCWDRDRQELRVGEHVVKQFKVPAPNQEVLLAVFHEEGWPVRIDDPLPPRADLEPKRRLHDTINSLNRNQKTPLVRFLGDGTGQGVRWEFTERALAFQNGGRRE